jgi:hypothetical protein
MRETQVLNEGMRVATREVCLSQSRLPTVWVSGGVLKWREGDALPTAGSAAAHKSQRPA